MYGCVLLLFAKPQLLLENMFCGAKLRTFSKLEALLCFHRISTLSEYSECRFCVFSGRYFHIHDEEFLYPGEGKHGNWKMTWRWNIRRVWMSWMGFWWGFWDIWFDGYAGLELRFIEDIFLVAFMDFGPLGQVVLSLFAYTVENFGRTI